MIKNLHRKVFLPAFIAGSVLAAKAQTGLNFDGTDDYVQTSYAGILGAADRTFEAWIYVPSTSPESNLAIFDYGNGTVGARNTFVVGGDKSLKYLGGGSNTNITTAAEAIPLDVWTHVAVVKDGGTGYLYINGVESGSGSLTGINTPTSGGQMATIGQRVLGGSIPFHGSIDEVRIWSVARSEAEIAENMNAEFCELPTGLEAYYKLNEGVAGADNTEVEVVNEVNPSAFNNLHNFDLMGEASNYVAGNIDSGLDLTVLAEETMLTANQAGATYQWVDVDNDNTAVDGATEQTFSPSVAGNYAVEITLGSCVEMSETVSFVEPGPSINVKTGLNFDGVDDYVQSPSIPVSGNNPCTVEAWVRTTKNSLPSGDGGDGQSVICDWGNPSPAQRFTLNLFWSNSVRLEVGQGGVSGTTPVNDGEWHHVAAVYDPTGSPHRVAVYVDGELDATGNFNNTSINIPQYGTGIRLGKRILDDNLFEGDIDEVRVWDYALTEAELQSRMNIELCGDEDGLAAYFPLGEGVAGTDNAGMTTVYDMSPSGNDGVLNNFTLSGDTSNWGEGHGLVSLMDATLTATQTGAAYQWVDCDNDNAVVDGATAQTFAPETSGNYAVEITVDGCVTTSACMAVDVNSLGVEETLMDNMKVYPNPTSGDLNVNLNGVYENVQVQLVSITGKVVGQYQFDNTNGFAIDLNNINSGLYFLNLKADNLDAATIKVVKM
ncbi:LamG-like jellyroll fold domain-containing protein [Mangrovimonas sp. YM274]|uniref:LamG-like jellyroll fold domain-containing protein n=1 Tax=Mangrovimonas sp. YM274 TaxID=3070660 RepID=UPI0027DC184D|nr:LamG-like jellyroll fold domain-containing protein [Mangrovimonas sp. YM274]WMI70226.1 LamG-like jellyroll fold domain-containing protein [Mangrovimonas sp. YM274]